MTSSGRSSAPHTEGLHLLIGPLPKHRGAHCMGRGYKTKRALLLAVLPPLSPPLERGEMRGREHSGVFLVGSEKGRLRRVERVQESLRRGGEYRGLGSWAEEIWATKCQREWVP